MDKTSYDILWYLNEYPNEVNATDDVISGSLKINRQDYKKAKDILINEGLIKQRVDNKNNAAWELTDEGRLYFNKLRDKFKADNPLALETGDKLNEVLIALHKSQIALNEVQAKSYRKENSRMYFGFIAGIITVCAGIVLTDFLSKDQAKKEAIIQVNVSTHNAAIDTVSVKTDTIEKK